MIGKFVTLLAALAVALTTLAPIASAHDRRDGYYDRRDDYYYDRRRRGNRDDDDDAVAAGVIGLVLGLAVGSLAAQEPRDRRTRCYDNYRRCDPPQGYYNRDYYDQGYADPRLDGGYDPRYDGYYEPRRPQCTRRERQWDRYARRYVYVDVPC